jgi:hypothetical protein
MNRCQSMVATGLLGLMATLQPARAATVDLAWSPADSSVGSGSTFDLQILGSYLGPATLAGGALDLQFDRTVLNVVSVLVNPAVGDFVTSAGVIDNAAGRVDSIAFASFFGVSGSFTLATVKFQAVGPGSSALLLSDANDAVYPWTNYDLGVSPAGDTVTPQFSAASVTVVPVPAGIWLLATGVMGIGIRGASSRKKVAVTAS